MDALHCPTCGYNLSGLPENRCPECGRVFELRQIPTHHVVLDLGWDIFRVALAFALQLGGFFLVATLLLTTLRVFAVDWILVDTIILAVLLGLGVFYSVRLTDRLYRLSRHLRSCGPELRTILFDWLHPRQDGPPLTAVTRVVGLGPRPDPPRTFAATSVGVLFVIHLFLAAMALSMSNEVVPAF